MRYGITAFIFLCLVGSAHAHQRHYHHYVAAHHQRGLYVCGGCVVRETLAGTVAVSAQNGDHLVGAINALVEAGFRGPVNCAAPYGTHVRNSLHHTGDACDMAQVGFGRTPARIMYHASAILARFGVNDGCWFGDCGHISIGAQEAGGHARRYAYRRHRVYTMRYVHRRRYARR